MPEKLLRLPLCDAMTLAAMADRKTQTRRLLTPQPSEGPGRKIGHIGPKLDGDPNLFRTWLDRRDEGHGPCEHDYNPETWRPRYAVGDRVVLTEAFRVIEDTSGEHCADVTVTVKYRCDGTIREGVVVPESHWGKPTSQPYPLWYPPRFMPLWAVRPGNERVITRVRCERVQAIGADEYSLDVFNEGICAVCEHCGTLYSDDQLEPPEVCGGHGGIGCHVDAIELFRELWDSLHGAGAWDRNEWVFAYSFKRLEARDA